MVCRLTAGGNRIRTIGSAISERLKTDGQGSGRARGDGRPRTGIAKIGCAAEPRWSRDLPRKIHATTLGLAISSQTTERPSRLDQANGRNQ